jgi:2-hydroxy-3-oxopropionate reductase
LAGGLAASQALSVKRSNIESNDYTPGGAANFQLKDLRFALEAGAATGTSLTMTEEVTRLYASLVESGDGGLDHSGIIREIERRCK